MVAGLAPPGGASAQDETGLIRNGGFEGGGALSALEAWRPVAGDFEARTDTLVTHEGQQSFRLSREPTSTARFAAVAQAIDAVPLRGRTVRFRAFAKLATAGTGSSGGLWLRVDREGGGRGFFDNMNDRPIQSTEWSAYEIVAPVASDATRLTVGFLLNGTGPGWIDTASLEIVPAEQDLPGDDSALGDQEVANLEAFTRLYGYVRWFSPHSDPNAGQWAQVARDGALAAQGAEDPTTLAAVLRDTFEPFAPDLAIEQAAFMDEAGPGAPDPTDLVRWRHVGVEFSSPAYRSERVDADQTERWRAEIGSGLFISMPLTARRSQLPVDAADPVLPIGPQGLNDRATRLAATLIAWNVFRHFYPYFSDDGQTWDTGLGDRLARAATASGPSDFRRSLQSMVADLNDGHGDVGPETEDYRLPFLTQMIENQLVITAVARGEDLPVEVGDVILTIDGKPVSEWMASEAALTSASTDAHRRWRAAEGVGTRPTGEPVDLGIGGADGQQRDVSVTPIATLRLSGRLTENRPAPVTWFPQGSWYLDLTRLNDERLNEALARVQPGQPVVFDLRGYPQDIKAGFLGRLTDTPVDTPPFLIPVDTRPEARGRTWEAVGWDVAPVPPRLQSAVVFLTDERAVSYAETLLAMVRGYKLAEIVGEPTAGMNGNINPFVLPGNHRIVWTGMRVLNHDETPLAGRGVQPTVPAEATIAGIREGRDEVLERGLDVATAGARSRSDPARRR